MMLLALGVYAVSEPLFFDLVLCGIRSESTTVRAHTKLVLRRTFGLRWSPGGRA